MSGHEACDEVRRSEDLHQGGPAGRRPDRGRPGDHRRRRLAVQECRKAATKMLVEQRAPAELEGSRFNRRSRPSATPPTARSPTTRPRRKPSRPATRSTRPTRRARSFLGKIKAADPAAAKEVNADFQTRFDRIYSSARQGADLGLQSANDAAKMVMGVIDPDIASPDQGRRDLSTNTHSDETQRHGGQGRQGAAAGTMMSSLCSA
jgi:methyl-accepting chemotaxis protein